MNPIIFVGLAALVITGVYAVQLGLAQQAELAELQRQVLAESSALAAAGGIRGEIHDRAHIIITNPTAHAAHLLQVRAYDADTGSRVGAWGLPHEVPPYGSANLTAALLPAAVPPSLLDLMQNTPADYSFRGVSAEGAVFDIIHERPPADARGGVLLGAGGLGNGTGAGNSTFVGLGTLLVEPGRRSESVSGHSDIYAYHKVASSELCQTFYSRPGISYRELWRLFTIYDEPFRVSDAAPRSYVTPAAAGDPDWHYLQYERRLSGGQHRHTLSCLLSGADPPGIEPVPGRSDMFRIRTATAGWDLGIRLPVEGGMTAPAGGTLRLYYEIPVQASAAVAYGLPTRTGEECSYRTGPRCGCVQSGIIDPANARARTAEQFTVPIPEIQTRLHFEKNGEPAGRLPARTFTYAYGGQWLTDPGGVRFSDILPVRDTDTDVRWTETGTGTRGPEAYCRGNVDTGITGSHTYSGTIRGDVKISDVSAGDTIAWRGAAVLDFAPRIPSGGLTATSASMTVSDTLVTVYVQAAAGAP